ncbi:hypothetical protein SOVF_067330 [Spinacia oleracea]|nr:hypothetical protein SOVF_067330 [Spinacia oleracea]
MNFCGKCNNILYIKEDRDLKILLYSCRYCEQQVIADSSCVYRKEIHPYVGESTQALQDVSRDSTLPRTKSVRCSQCNQGEAVFYQKKLEGVEGMTLFFICCNPTCSHEWRD